MRGDLGERIAREGRCSRWLNSIIGASVADGVGEHADAGDLDLHDVAVAERPDAGRRAGRDQIARLERHDAADVRHQERNREVHVGGRRALALLRRSPGRSPRASRQSRPAATAGPTGQKVSNPLARPHWPSVFCRSRQVTSLTHTNPPIASLGLGLGRRREAACR